jgi:hypothetical protein
MLQNKIKMISLIKGKGVTPRDVITPPLNLLMKNYKSKEYSEGILNILNSSNGYQKRASSLLSKSTVFNN